MKLSIKLGILRWICNIFTALMLFIVAKITNYDVAILAGIALILTNQIFENEKE